MKSALLVETKARELVERTQWRAERTIPRSARPRAAESECEEPADLFGHAPMRRQLAARHRDETVRVPEDRVIPGNVRIRFLRSAFATAGTHASVRPHAVGTSQTVVRHR